MAEMLQNQWYAMDPRGIGRSPRAVRRFGRDLVAWRDGDGVCRVAVDACPHRGAALSRGRVVDGCLTCPYHGFSYGSDGRCTRMPALPDAEPPEALALRMFPCREARGLLWIWNGSEEPGSLPWDDAFERELSGTSEGPFLDLCDVFDVSYLRVMENLTDVHHVAHVHRWTIPAPAEVTAFDARREGRHVYVDVELGGSFRATIHIVAPFCAILEFAGTARFAVVVSPVDDDRVWLFARYTQTVVRVPGLTWLATWLLGTFDYALLQRLQDAPVWRSQRLADPADIGRYTLIEPDGGVRLYFDIHRELAG